MREQRQRTYGHQAPSGELAVTCYCEDRVVFVPRDDVLACRTKSCGLPMCDYLARKAAA